MSQLTIANLLESPNVESLIRRQSTAPKNLDERLAKKTALTALIIDSPFNRRNDLGDLTALKENIELRRKVPSILMGLAGFNGEIFVTDGFRRLAALKQLHQEGKCLDIGHVWLMEEDISHCQNSKDILAHCLSTQITANQGLKFSQLDQANIFRDLSAQGFSRTETAKICGVSESTISECLQLLAVPKEVMEFAREENISTTVVMLASRKSSNPDQMGFILRTAARNAKEENRRPGKADIEEAARTILPPEPSQLAVVPDEISKQPSIMQLYEEGLSMAQIQKRLKIAWSTVNRVVSSYRRDHQFDWLLEHGVQARRPPLDYYTNYDWARECCNLSRQAASTLLGIGPDEIEAVETLQKKPTEEAIRNMTVIYGRWLPGLSSDHLLGIQDFRSFLDAIHRRSVVSAASWKN